MSGNNDYFDPDGGLILPKQELSIGDNIVAQTKSRLSPIRTTLKHKPLNREGTEKCLKICAKAKIVIVVAVAR